MPFDEDYAEAYYIVEHSLNTNNLENLGEQIASKLNCNVEWGSWQKLTYLKAKIWNRVGKSINSIAQISYKIWYCTEKEEIGFINVSDGENDYQFGKYALKFITWPAKMTIENYNNPIYFEKAFFDAIGAGKREVIYQRKPQFLHTETLDEFLERCKIYNANPNRWLQEDDDEK